MSNQTFFVTTATGRQGGAVTHHLLKNNCSVHIITRNPDSPASQKLQKLGVKIVTGELDNEEALKAGMQGCTGLFLNVPYDPHDPIAAENYAKCILNAAKISGIKHVVRSTSLGANAPEKFALGSSSNMIEILSRHKQVIENMVRNYGLDYWTILRPGNFMANFIKPKVSGVHPDLETTGVWNTSLGQETLIPMVDHDDIGKFGAAALLAPERFNQKEIEIASELLTADQVVAELSKATNKKLSTHHLSDEDLEIEAAKNSPASWQRALKILINFVDMGKVRAWEIPLNTFADFLQRERDSVIGTYAEIP